LRRAVRRVKLSAMSDPTLSLFLPDDAATTCLGGLFAQLLRAGDTVLLSGAIGAGKTHLVRSLIRKRLNRMEDVPSPTFTLVQVYDADVEIWHADLYRLSHPDEALELGLDEAFGAAICLVEWPDRLGDLAPKDAVTLVLAPEGEGRRITLTGGRAGLLAQIKAGMDG
jgi:tRNA threonylcarbamoyladenosine biosynthesis protein TsaE